MSTLNDKRLRAIAKYGVGYVAFVWLLLQVTVVVTDIFSLPVWVPPTVAVIGAIVGLLSAVLLYSYELSKSEEIAEVLDNAATYEKMREDAAACSQMYLTSFQRGISSGSAIESKTPYFDYIDETIINRTKPVWRMTVRGGAEKFKEIKRTLKQGADNPNFRLSVFTENDDVTYNLQIYKGVAAYIIDPVYALDNSREEARHVRIVGRKIEKRLLDKYLRTWKGTKPIKDENGVNEINLREIENLSRKTEAESNRSMGRPLVYSLDNPDNPRAGISLVDERRIELFDWSEFARAIPHEKSLIAYKKNSLLSRCKKRRAAIIVNGTEILSHISVRPLLDYDIGSMLLGSDSMTLGSKVKVAEMATGWTRRDIRRNGLSTRLRRKLIDASVENGVLLLSFCKETAASPVLSKLDWRLISWEEFPFLSSLIGWFYGDTYYKVSVGELPTNGKAPWNGPHREYEESLGSDFDRHFNLWAYDTTNNQSIVREYNRLIREKIEIYRKFKDESGEDSRSHEGDLEWWRETLRTKMGQRSEVVQGSYQY